MVINITSCSQNYFSFKIPGAGATLLRSDVDDPPVSGLFMSKFKEIAGHPG